MRHDSEPSVEEILDSIKKVIARDNRGRAEQARRVRENTGMPAGTSERELIEPADSDEADEILDLGTDAELLAEDEAPGGLTNPQSAESMRESLAALAMLAEPGAQPQIVRSGETSLEGLVREMLRPMLAQWLDDNLPATVDRLVQAEIARIAGKKG
ncbi:DUF2497 domain-containing protein [Paraurantiacibacter namhicola]|uniref:DUF2497 domain-containing protein n=1 Tax=Paraurantiacibacter namhicola TaxID=645517 RepID=A0A1C7D5Z1_9SPHN|nr:DUF2497 domain-containing protein [Paraurantiacibacter namhicola]ANU06772.1 hypothetical protein A6F65_00447 [Paraurantiacibacter namhicola]